MSHPNDNPEFQQQLLNSLSDMNNNMSLMIHSFSTFQSFLSQYVTSNQNINATINSNPSNISNTAITGSISNTQDGIARTNSSSSTSSSSSTDSNTAFGFNTNQTNSIINENNENINKNGTNSLNNTNNQNDTNRVTTVATTHDNVNNNINNINKINNKDMNGTMGNTIDNNNLDTIGQETTPPPLVSKIDPITDEKEEFDDITHQDDFEHGVRSLDSEDSVSYDENDTNIVNTNGYKSNNNNNNRKHKNISKTPNSKFSKYYFQSHSTINTLKGSKSNKTNKGNRSRGHSNNSNNYNNYSSYNIYSNGSPGRGVAASTRARLRSLAKSTDFANNNYDFTPSYAESSHITYDSNGNVKNTNYSNSSPSSAILKYKNRAKKSLKSKMMKMNSITRSIDSTNNNNNNNNGLNDGNNNNNNNTNGNDNNGNDGNIANGTNDIMNGIHSPKSQNKEIENDYNGSYQTLQKSKSQTDILDKHRRSGRYRSNKSNHSSHTTEHIYLNTENRLTINVGGTLFETTINTLAADHGSMLSAMFSGRFNLEKDENGAFFIDRDPTHFRHILNFLRDGVDYLKKGGLLQQPEGIVNELLQEARFYNIRPLVDYITLQQMRRNKKKGDELTHEKQYKLVTNVKMEKLEETFNRVTGNDGFDFENWLFIPPYKTTRNNYTQMSFHMLFSKKLSCAEVRLLDRLTNIGMH